MEIPSTSSSLHSFQTNQRFKIKADGCKLPKNHKFYLNPQILNRIGNDRKESYDVTNGPKKRKNSHEENPSKKKQKKAIEVNSTSKTKSIVASNVSLLHKTASKSKIAKPENAKSENAKPENAKPVTAKVTKPDKSFMLPKTKTEPKIIENKNQSFSELIAKAKKMVQEKRQINHRNADIARQRIIARLALNQMSPTVDFENHLKYHQELEQLGCDFIHDQVSCLNMFSLMSRSDFTDESNSILEKNKTSRCDDEDSIRKRQRRSTTDRSNC